MMADVDTPPPPCPLPLKGEREKTEMTALKALSPRLRGAQPEGVFL